jgi:abortive infection bacteriophage resistance protein
MQYDKPPKTFPEQLEILKSRGLAIPDLSVAEAFLSHTNYYRLTAYYIPFQNPRDVFVPGSTFKDVCRLYEFDRRLRLIAAEALEIIEVAVRTKAAYYFALEHTAFGHADVNNFNSDNIHFFHATWLSHLHTDIENSTERFITHYRETYEDFPLIPIWMAVEVMTFGSLSKFYSGMKYKDQKTVADGFGCNAGYFGNWLHVFTRVRNICAHHAKLWNKSLTPLGLPGDKHDWRGFANNRIGTALVCIHHVLATISAEHAGQFRSKLTALLSEPLPLPDITAQMGLPENWKEHPLWKR